MAQTKKERMEYIRQYEKVNVKAYRLRLNKITDKDVIDKIEEQPNKINYIRQLILADIRKASV